MLYTYLTLILTMLFWGGTFIAGRALAGIVPPASAAFLRFSIATVALALLVLLIDGRLSLPRRQQWPALLVLGASGVFGYNVCFFNGLQWIEAGRASLIIALNPLVITVLAALLFREQLAPRQWAGIGLSLIGAMLVISNGQPGQLLAGSFGRGELAILGCVASWATYSLVGRSLLATMTPLACVFYSSLIGTLLLALLAVPEGVLTRLPAITAGSWLSLAFLGICGTALGFSLYYQAIKKIGASRSGVFINLVPFFAVLLSWLLLDETIRGAVAGGGLLLLFGVTLTNYRAAAKP